MYFFYFDYSVEFLEVAGLTYVSFTIFQVV